jgi:ketol-acid reductoisomerase
MGEQTILCGMLQTGSILCFDKMVEEGIEPCFKVDSIRLGNSNWSTAWGNYEYDGSFE